MAYSRSESICLTESQFVSQYQSLSRPHRVEQVGTGVHFVFEVESRPKFSAEHDPVHRFLKKCAQVAFLGGCSHFGGAK